MRIIKQVGTQTIKFMGLSMSITQVDGLGENEVVIDNQEPGNICKVFDISSGNVEFKEYCIFIPIENDN